MNRRNGYELEKETFRRTANLLFNACMHEGQEDLLRSGAECLNGDNNPDAIDDTVAPDPYLPLIVGMEWVYRMETGDDDGEPVVGETVIPVTDKVTEIDGIPCRVVRDTVKINGELLEDSNDWMAQDIWGNAWHCGEELKHYEIFEGDSPAEPEPVAIDGSFKAGEEDARAGILVFADPQVGVTYREEAARNEAEDLSEVLSVTASESVDGFDCRGTVLSCVRFRRWILA
ncbi:MAG: hypothetical protein H6993_00225 [Pseudomonadales bacterium]|nr:hypothetical protein [Pseudomonadales bacterium]MCP5182348.1 hypothetical protein [Pseudomonadales bacterium]